VREFGKTVDDSLIGDSDEDFRVSLWRFIENALSISSRAKKRTNRRKTAFYPSDDQSQETWRETKESEGGGPPVFAPSPHHSSGRARFDAPDAGLAAALTRGVLFSTG
jgi:hypothetical protein